MQHTTKNNSIADSVNYLSYTSTTRGVKARARNSARATVNMFVYDAVYTKVYLIVRSSLANSIVTSIYSHINEHIIAIPKLKFKHTR